MAWHVRPMLGDALWRSGADVALPDGLSPAQWVDRLDDRLKLVDSVPHLPH
jgi:hypothetical protein